ncbi:MAG: hypothetical protein JXM68_14710 [Sedimentisphaerales bacterium]|nr:hypothetical protein [Sedimentisphaerales bacterium]
METINILSGIIVIMLAMPQITFNRRRAWLWISFLVISGFFIVTTVAHLLLSLTIGIYDCESNPDLFLKIITIASPTVAIPYIILKLYWGQQDKAKDIELKERELELKEKEIARAVLESRRE